jgi:hypothetical protein
VIRQAISCDICGAEKKQTNHWFVAYTQAGELRVSGWDSRNRLRVGTKHLCGQTCLHKLVDDFFAKTVASRNQAAAAAAAEVEELAPRTDASLTSNAAYDDFESSARLVTPVAPIPPQRAIPPPAALVAMPSRLPGQEPRPLTPPPIETAPNYSSRHWRAEAWEREREREMRAGNRRPDAEVRRRKTS